jgi:hypothetical protein
LVPAVGRRASLLSFRHVTSSFEMSTLRAHASHV